MAFKETCQVTTLNGTTAVTVVTAPVKDEVVVVRSINVDNKDTSAFDITVQINKNSVLYRIKKQTIAAGADIGAEIDLGDNRIALADTDETLECKMDGAPVATQPAVTVHMARER